MRPVATEDYSKYFSYIEREVERIFEVAKKARAKGVDPSLEPESSIARDLAERVEKLVELPGLAERIRELSKVTSREILTLKISEEILYGRFGHFEAKEAAEKAIRTALAILTEGITAAPLQGITRVDVKRNADRTNYLAIYFAGPIRSAGGTEQGLILVIADFIRRILGLDSYKPMEQEIRRFIEEIRIYERNVARFQFHVPDEVLDFALRNIPVEVTGVGTDPFESVSFRNLPRIETNQVRGGALLVLNDGLIGRSRKISKIVEEMGIDGWEWLKTVYEEEETAIKPAYLEEVIGGRPIFSLPGRIGGFRLRYGRCRNTGLAAIGIHPATMVILKDFLGIGTQLRIEKPGKAAIITPVDTIEPPIVKLKDGSVVRVESVEEARRIQPFLEKILFLGDILVSLGDFIENNKPLELPGFSEEWWAQDALYSIIETFGSVDKAASAACISSERLKAILSLREIPSAEEAVILARKFNVPLHPRYTYFWSAATVDDIVRLRSELLTASKTIEGGIVKKIEATLTGEAKAALEVIAIPHSVEVNGKVTIEDDAPSIDSCLALDDPGRMVKSATTALEAVKELSGLDVREKAPTFIGTRMGRPEKAERRKMKPPVHILFPVGLAGGPRRDLVSASREATIEVEIARRRCLRCKSITHRIKCSLCGFETKLERVCPVCLTVTEKDRCGVCGRLSVAYEKRPIPIKELYRKAVENAGVMVDLVKGVRGLSSASKIPEPIEKGILRAKYDITVYRDGTTRFDVTNAPLTHFRPSEIGTSVKKLHELGYTADCKGSQLQTDDQLCELKVQDIIIPRKAAKYLVRVAKFVDDILEKLYGLPPFYNASKEEDLVGHLIVGLAPHTSAGVVGRIIGFTAASVCYAHPLFHAAKRRDCDGDEDALMLLAEVLLNFSKEYIPAKIGGVMDAPLIIIPIIDPAEVDKEAHNMDIAGSYPLVFYERALQGDDPRTVGNIIDLVMHRLGKESQYEGYRYTHETSSITAGNLESVYKRLKTMEEKLVNQVALAEIIRSVDVKEMVKSVLSTHFIRDIMGNLKAFSLQKFRCQKCNKKFRRMPLRGLCACGGKLVLTVHRGGIEKYLGLAETLARKYDLEDYFQDRIAIIKEQIRSLFAVKAIREEEQPSLLEFM